MQQESGGRVAEAEGRSEVAPTKRLTAAAALDGGKIEQAALDGAGKAPTLQVL